MELSPVDPKVLVSYGEALRLLGHMDDSREVLSKAYALEPAFLGWHSYSRTLLDLGEIEDAISPLELLINNKSVQDPGIYLDYAGVLTLHKHDSTTNSPMKALIALNEPHAIDPDLAEAKAEPLKLWQPVERTSWLSRHIQAPDTSSEDKEWSERLSYGFGCIASAVGKYDIAVAALQEASLANPNNPAIFMALSDAYLSANLPEDALHSARNVLVMDGENPDSLAWFARYGVKIIRTQPLDSSNAATGLAKQVPSRHSLP
jgi:tetratricopeptide (TPR) repeat protein